MNNRKTPHLGRRCSTVSPETRLKLKEYTGDSMKTLKLIKTKMAKSVLDSGFSAFRTMLKYKCDEKYTTQTCSCCGTITDNSPKGRAGLRIREWTCSACNTTHDRDVNAAKNILRIRRDTLVGGVPDFNKEKTS